jgi:hypothetical protein
VSEAGRPEPRVPASALALLLGACAVVAVALPHAAESYPLSAFAKLCAAGLCVVVIPGSVVVLVAGARKGQSLLEIVGLGIPVSLTLVQIATITSLGLHVPARTVASCWLALIVIGAALAALRTRGVGIAFPVSEIAIGSLIVVLGCALYLKGSPLGGAEDWSHAAIVRRLAFLEAPAIGNFYHSPGVMYTHPLPGTHFAMSLVARIGDLDALFVYHKMRFLWSISATLTLYALARRTFEDGRLAAAAVAAALVLTFNGTFADVPGVGWAQLATYSHPSDVALGVLLPGFLALAAYYLRASHGAERAWTLVAALGMAATLTMVHIRETVQSLVYLGGFAVALVIFDGERQVLRRALLLTAMMVAIVLGYVAFHRSTVPAIAALDQAGKSELVAWIRHASLRDLYRRPLPISVGRIDSLFHAWMPGVLLLSPLLSFALRCRVLVWLPAASIVAYMLLIRFPFLSFPYVYLTYWEMLLTPGRNVAIFVHLLTGLALLAAAAHLSRIGRTWGATLATVTAGCAIAVLMRGLGPWMAHHQDLLFLGVLGGFAAVLLLLWRRAGAGLAAALLPHEARAGRAWLYPLLVTVAAAVSFLPELSPLNASPAVRSYESLPPVAARLSPRGLIEGLKCTRSASPAGGEERKSCPPSLGLVEWAERTLPAGAVLSADTFNAYPLPAFMHQQVAAWPVAASENLVDARALYPAYYERFDRTMKLGGVQPFFNATEGLTERVEFLRALGVTHIVVDPPYQRLMARVLGQWPQAFASVYDDGAWTVYEVTIPMEGRRTG